MSMLRWLRIFLPLLLVALVVAAVVLVFSSRNDLRQARGRVNTAWKPLQSQLDSRYVVLHTAFSDDTIRSVPGPFHAIVSQVAFAYQHWRDLEQHDGSVADEVAAANDLEAAGRRLVQAAQQAPRLKGNQAALAVIDAYANNSLPSSAPVVTTRSPTTTPPRPGSPSRSLPLRPGRGAGPRDCRTRSLWSLA
jgi:hypothetical protein